MRKRFAILMMLIIALPAVLVQAVGASPADEYSGPYFGEDNFPPGCIRDMSVDNPDNICHHMRTGLNALDSPQIDVLILVPVSPTAERDMRIMRQSIEMWEGGVDYLAQEMGLDWLHEGVDFHITVDYVDLEDGGEFTTYPIVDPEVVVIATNPVGGVGIGFDPLWLGDEIFGTGAEGPCHGIANPFDFEAWENLPGFDSHHESRTGTYTEDCDGAGGNICFAVNGAIDPDPETIDFFGLFDLVSHEVGHCLTLGHVGDGAEGDWAVVPTNDIMAYHADPPGLTKCVSTLDVEAFAARMSGYLDVNGDGVVDEGDQLLVNDQVGEGGNPFQVQHPDDHLYASGTGSPMDCPQPDIGLVPGGERTDWTPTPVQTSESVLTVTSPEDGAVTTTGTVDVTGTVEHIDLTEPTDQPTSPVATHDDADDDASSPLTEILQLDVEVTEPTVEATISLAELWPSTDVVSGTSYSVVINGRKFDSFVRYATDPNPMTWDTGAGAYMDAGASTWDLEARTVTFHIPRDYLAGAGVVSPYFVSSSANVGGLVINVVDDLAPDEGTVGVAGAQVFSPNANVIIGEFADRVEFEHPDGNTFHTENTSFGVEELGQAHYFTLDVTEPSNLEFTMTWSDNVGGADLDLYVTGAADSGSQGATVETTETVVLNDVQGLLDIRVEPYFISDPVGGATYSLSAEITPVGTTTPDDRDGDGVPDDQDACPDVAGEAPDGCPSDPTDPPAPTELVHVYVDDVLTASQAVDSSSGADTFALAVDVPEGEHVLRVEWEDNGTVLDSQTRTVSYVPSTSGSDRDGDGIADADDNCTNKANADQSDIDGDGRGDECDPDIDGDGHSNGKEAAHGTDPYDPDSYPGSRGSA